MLPAGLRTDLFRGGLGTATLRLTGLFFGVLITIVLARTLGPENLGVYALALAFVTLISIPVQAGLPVLAVREVAGYRGQASWGYLRGLLSWIHLMVFGFSVAIGGSLLLLLSGETIVLSESLRKSLFWGLLLVPVLALGNLRGAVLRGLKRVVVGQLPETVVRPLMMLVLLGVVLLGPWPLYLEPETTVLLYLIAGTVGFVVGSLILHRVIPPPVLQAKPQREVRRWLTSLAPLTLIAGLHIVVSHTDILMLGALSSMEEVGFYKVAMQVGLLVGFVQKALGQVVAPYVVEFYQGGQRDLLQRMVSLSGWVVFASGGLIATAFVVFGREILSLAFGAAYLDAYAALVVLTLGALGYTMFGTIMMLFNMTRNEGVVAKSIGVVAISNVFLNALLIPAWGGVGAAVATVTSMLIWKIYLAWRLFDLTGISSFVISRRAMFHVLGKRR